MKKETKTEDILLESRTFSNQGLPAYKYYESGKVEVECAACNKWRELEKDKIDKFLTYWKDVPNYTCLKCYQNKVYEKPQDSIQDRIQFAQAFNLAVALNSQVFADMVKAEGKNAPEVMKKLILGWQEWFYEELKKHN